MTGVTAGIYIANNGDAARGADAEYAHYDTKFEDAGDTLPSTLTPSALANQ